MKLLITIFIVFVVKTGFSQDNGSTNRKRKFELEVALGLLPINQKSSSVNFNYYDGTGNTNEPIDTISAVYNLSRQYFNSTLGVGINYYFKNHFKAFFRIHPHLNTFRSNKGKNTKVYGMQLDLGAALERRLNETLFFNGGLSISYIIGGYGITSGGATNKAYLNVNENRLFDDDIGFHIIDNNWSITPHARITRVISEKIGIFMEIGYQLTFSRSARMNFAGESEDGNVLWNRKSFDDADVSLEIDGHKISKDRVDKLPYQYGGAMIVFGITFLTGKRA